MKLSNLKESNPVPKAEFAVVQGVDHEPDFIKHLLMKRDRIIASIKKLQSRCLNKSHMFGIELPKTVEQISPWMPRMAIPYGQMQYLKSLRMSTWHLRFYQMGTRHP